MPTLAESRQLRLLTLTAMYFAQGIPWGFISVGYALLLADLGLGNAAVGAAMGMAYLPWSFKILWGPLLDSMPSLRFGRRRPFIIAAEAGMGLTLLALIPLDPRTALPAVSLLLFLHNTCASLQDVAVDALAVELLEEDERGRANALMWAGKSLGVALGGGGGAVISKYFGWSTLLLGMVVVLWAIMLLPIFLRERPARDGDVPASWGLLRHSSFLLPFVAVGGVLWALSRFEGDWVAIAQPFAAVLVALLAWPLVDRVGFGAMRRSFSFVTPWWGVAAAALTPVGYALVSAPMARMLRADLHLSEEQIGFLTGVVDPIAGVSGALIGGVIADRLGARPAVGGLMGGIAVVLGIFSLTEVWWPSYTFLIGWTIAQTLLINAYSTGTLGLFMGLSNPRIGATHFAIYMATTNLTYAWAAPLGGVLADRFGMVALFGIAAVVQIATIAVVPGLDARRAAAHYAAGALPDLTSQ